MGKTQGVLCTAGFARSRRDLCRVANRRGVTAFLSPLSNKVFITISGKALDSAFPGWYNIDRVQRQQAFVSPAENAV